VLPFSCSCVWSAPLHQGGAIQFWMLPSVPEISSSIHLLPCLGRLLCHPTTCCQSLCFYWSLLSAGVSSRRLVFCFNPSLSLYASPNLWWVPAAPLHYWLVTPPLLSDFSALCTCHWMFGSESSTPCPHPWWCSTESSAPFPNPEILALRVWLFAPPPLSGAESVFHLHLQCQC
jgi:hypothetical protein